MNDIYEALFCPVHGAVGWLLLCWPCAFFGIRKFFNFLLDCATKHAKTSTTNERN